MALYRYYSIPGDVITGWPTFLLLLIVILVALQVIVRLLSLAHLISSTMKAVESLQMLWSKSRTLLIVRWVLALVGLGFWYWLWEGIQPNSATEEYLVFVPVTCIFLSETIGRCFFYASYQREGI
jgi:hypothetical protein